MSTETGGPAFPLPVADQECCGRFESGYGGMSLRDYFAAHAPITLDDARAAMKDMDRISYTWQDVIDMLAHIRAGYADAMLAAMDGSASPADPEHTCPGCGCNGWPASCNQCTSC